MECDRVQMKMTHDDQYLITISEDSCIMIWKVQDREGRNLKHGKETLYAEEILITKSDLEDKVFTSLCILRNLFVCPSVLCLPLS